MSSTLGLVTDRRTDRRTESDAYEPTVQCAQVGSNIKVQQDKALKSRQIFHSFSDLIIGESNRITCIICFPLEVSEN